MVTKPMTYGVTSDPAANYIQTWSKDVDDRTEVREGGACISDCTGSDGDGRVNTSGRSVRSVRIRVTSSDLVNLESRIKIIRLKGGVTYCDMNTSICELEIRSKGGYS